MTEFEENKEIARETADMAGNRIVECGYSVDVLAMTAYMLMEDYTRIMLSAKEILEENRKIKE